MIDFHTLHPFLKRYMLFFYILHGSLQTVECYFENCDRRIQIAKNDSLRILSPNFPFSYPPGSSCRNIVSAPNGYEVRAQCQIFLNKESNNSCGTEFFYLSQENDESLQHAEIFCGTQFIQRDSLFRTISMAYFSLDQNFGQGGAYFCIFTSKPTDCDCGWSVDTKIVGGREAQPHEFPFMAGIIDLEQSLLFCGGSIISDTFILTAAHCLYGRSVCKTAVDIGEHNITSVSQVRKLLRIRTFIIHENYNPNTSGNDIALAQTIDHIEWSRAIGPVCLPLLYPYADFTNQPVEIAGWGTIDYGGRKSNILMKAETRVLSIEECNVGSDILCTYSNTSDSCQFDSGGPVILLRQRMFLVGIIASGFGCSGLGYNTRITTYLNWIVSKTGNQYCRKTLQ